MKNFKQKNLGLLSASLIVSLLSGCGGGGGSTTPDDTTTYTVGGSVSGLAGSGLVLQNNGGDSLAVNADGNFTFATALDDAASYAVTVSTSPTTPAQTCSVTNDTGTISAANITDVAVACVDDISPTLSSSTPANNATNVERNATMTATFNEDMIASTVNGTNITLSDGSNVAGAVTFDALTNVATFTPTNELALLRNYTANLNTSITDLSGNALANTNITFTTRDGVWGTEATIDSEDLGDAGSQQIVFDINGNAIVVWAQSNGTIVNIWANRYVVDVGWGTAELIETDNAGSASAPQIAFDSTGNAIAVWRQSDGTRNNIWANRYVNGTGWGTAALIETDNVGGAGDVKVSMDASGNAIALWSQYDGSQFNIVANRYVAGSGWGTAELIETDNLGDANNPQISIQANGNAIAVWQQHDGVRDNIWANRYVVGSGWDTAELIEADNNGYTQDPQIAIDPNGNAIAVWSQTFATVSERTVANRYVPGSGWGTATIIDAAPTEHSYNPTIAMNASGNAIVMWSYDDGTNYFVTSINYTVGSGWGTTVNAYDSTLGSADDPDFSMEDNGNVLAVWQADDGTGVYDVWANRYTESAGWGTASIIESGAGDLFNVRMASDQNGNAIAVWYQHDGTRENIMSNRFE